METPKKVDEAETTLPVLTPKVAGGSQRVIKQIMVIDPNKLRLSGLDVKMAEALKKAKKKNQPKSKESKLAAAKSILNKKLKEALSKKDAANVTSPKTQAKNVISVEESTSNTSSSDKNKAGREKQKLSVATLKSLMSPPSFPVSSLISPSQTVEIKVLNSQKTNQSIEVKIVDSSVEEPRKIDIFPKASLKPQITKTEDITPNVKSYGRKKSCISEIPDQPKDVKAQASIETSQTTILPTKAKTKTEVVTPKVKSYGRKKSVISEIPDQSKEGSAEVGVETSQTPILTIEAKTKTEVVTPKVKSYGRKKSVISEIPDQPKEVSAQVGVETSQTPILTIEAKTKTEVVTPKVKSYGRKKSVISEIPDQPKEVSAEVGVETSQTPILSIEAKTKTEVVTPKVKSYGRKKSGISEIPAQAKDVSDLATDEIPETVILSIEANKKTENPIIASLKENDNLEIVDIKSVTNAVERLKDKPVEIVQYAPSPKEDKCLNENITQLAISKETFLEMGVEKSINEASLWAVDNNASVSAPNTTDLCSKIVSSTPLRQKSLPQVIESKVLLPEEKIDLSILTRTTGTTLTVPKKRYKLDQNWISSEPNLEESVSINLSPVAGPSSSKPVEQESAVDFINNLSVFFAESPRNTSLNESVPEILTKECGEDATSFLLSLFQQKQDVSQEAPVTPAQESEGPKEVTLKSYSKVEKQIPAIDSSLKISSDTSKNIVLDLDRNNSQTKENDSNKDIERVEEKLHKTTFDDSKSPSKFQIDEEIVQNSKSMITTLKRKTDKQSEDLIEYHSGTSKNELNSTHSLSEDNENSSSMPISSSSHTSHVSESLQKSVSKSSTPPVSNRRKGSKPIPVLVPKLKKSRKPPTPAETPPDEKITENSTDKPEKESPTQPVKNKEALTDSVPSESTLVETKTTEIPEKSAQIATQKFKRKPKATLTSSASRASKDSANLFEDLPAASKTERPQRQRKMSLKLIESSEFLTSNKSPSQEVVEQTVEQIINKNRESETPTESPQRQRKVSFKLLDSSEQAFQSEKELATKTERPQRQRRMTLKLLESSESLPSMKLLAPVNIRSGEQEIKEQIQLDSASETHQSPESSTKNTSSDGLVAIEMIGDVPKDPIAQLIAFHETVEKIEVVNSKRTQNEAKITEEEGGSLSEYPFYDAICSGISSESVQSNQPTMDKENVSVEHTKTKILRRRKDSLKSRTFSGDQISIVSSDSSDTCDRIPKNVETVPSINQSRKPKETTMICLSDKGKEDTLELTPRLTETKPHARNLVSEMEQTEERFSPESKEMSNNSKDLENLNNTVSFPLPPESINTETPTNSSGKKRRARNPKLNKLFPKQKVKASFNETEKTKLFPFTDHHDQRVIEVKLLEEAEVSSRTAVDGLTEPIKTMTRRKSNFGGSWETLPSADEDVSQEVKTGKSRRNSYSLNSRCEGENSEKKDKVDKLEKVSVITEDSQTVVHINTGDVGPGVDQLTNVLSTKSLIETAENNPTKEKNHSLLTDDYTSNLISSNKGNESNSIKDLPVDKMRRSDSLKSIQAEDQVSDGQSTSKADSCSHPNILETPKTNDIVQEGNEYLSKLSQNSMDTEVLNISLSAPHANASHANELQITSNDAFLDEHKSSTTESEGSPSQQKNDLLKTKEQPKIAPEYEDLMFDLDHIESPSFSPICESSRISTDLGGFEEFGEDLTSAIINTVKEAENTAEKSKEKHSNSSVDVEKSSHVLESKQESTLSSIDFKSVIVTQFSSKSTDCPKPTESSKPISVTESSTLQSIDPSSVTPIDEQNAPSPVLIMKCNEEAILNSPNYCHKSPNPSKSKVESTEGKTKKSSALHSTVLNQSIEILKDTSKSMSKNPFKKQILNDSERESESKSDFLGFNEKEIEEGQQSTSLRLSQSEDFESLSTELPSVSKIKPKRNIKESQSGSEKKKKPEKQKWEKNSAKTLKNWLSKPVKNVSKDNVCDIHENVKEKSSSFPPKKRRSKAQNSTEATSHENDVKPLKQEVQDAETIVISADVSVIDKTINSADKKEKHKRGRKPKLKNALEVEKNSSEKITSFIEDTLKREEAINDDDFKTPKCGRKSKRVNQTLSSAKEQTENLPIATRERANKRKRSMSEENTPLTLEPPSKIANLYGNVFPTKRKAGRPKKFAVEGTLPVPVVQNSPKEKKYKDDCEFNPRLLLIRKKEELKSDEPLVDPSLQTEPIGPDDVQCALCMGYTSKKKWIHHVSTHYGIGWIVGHPPPLNIYSRGSILSFLLEFYKVSKVKGLNCRLCNSLRRSALGLLMHLEQCCLTEAEMNENRVVCEYCKKNYTKSSYQSHKRTCSEYLKQVLEESKVETPEIREGTTPDDVLSNTGRLKRKAVIKAETKLKKLDEANEFVADDLIKTIPSQNIRSIESIKENWIMEINSFGKGFCASKTCSFTATVIDDLIDHYQDKICPYYEKSGHFCVKCKFYSENIETVKSHVIEKHSPKLSKQKLDSDADFGSSKSSESITSEDDEVESESGSMVEDENGERKPKRLKKPKSKARRRGFQSKNPPTKEYKKLIPERCSISNLQDIVAKFYDKFIEANYSVDPLFTFAKANYVLIDASESYFPKSTNSMKFIHNGFNGFVKTLGQSKVEDDQWKQLERLHGKTENGEYIIYMGGPVKNIVWVPLDPHPPSNSQYLAITVRKGLDKFTRFLNQKRSRSLIFILKFDISLPLEIKAEIIYAIAIDEGPIQAIEFLPSGGYSPEMNRLGMLAVGTIETEIKIYSLPLRVEKNDCDLFPIVKLEASIELHLEVLDSAIDTAKMYNSQCTCLVWSQSAGHNIIVASFLNGFVGIWDVSDDPGNLNRFNFNKSKRFTPVSFFWTLEDRLLHLALHYDMNGPRWLAASNSTRKLLIYDLRDITQPMLLRVEVTINIINCIQWPNVWENIMFGLGDAMPSNGSVISVLSPMNIMFATRRFEKFCTGVSDIDFNIWRNSFAAGADNGDVQVTPLREAVLDVAQRLKIDEKIISTLDIVPLNGENISQNGIQIPKDGKRVFDKDFRDQYGIVFGSVRKIKGCNKPDYYSNQRVPPLNLQRLMRISKIRFNQNKNACDVLAVGYENGLLRVNVHECQKKP